LQSNYDHLIQVTDGNCDLAVEMFLDSGGGGGGGGHFGGMRPASPYNYNDPPVQRSVSQKLAESHGFYAQKLMRRDYEFMRDQQDFYF